MKRPSQGKPSSGGSNKSVGGVASTPYKPINASFTNKPRAKRSK